MGNDNQKAPMPAPVKQVDPMEALVNMKMTAKSFER